MFYQRMQALCNRDGTEISNVLKALNLSTSKGTAWKGTAQKEGTIPKGDILLKLANYFRVSTDYLLGNTDDPAPAGQKESSPKTEELPPTYYQLTPERRAQADSYLAFLLAEQQKEQT